MEERNEAERQAGLLNGWRAIADYLGRNQSTVKRWEVEGQLPVHRPKGGVSRKGVPVYAFADELDIWLKGRPDGSEPDEGSASSAPPPVRQKEGYSQPGQEKSDEFGEGNRLAYRFSRRHLIGGALTGCGLLALPATFTMRRQRADVQIASVTDGLSPEARQLYLDAQYLWQRRTPDSLREAERLLLRVTQLAPDFGQAQADLATIYDLMVEYGVLSPSEGYSRSKSAAQLAIVLDPELASAYSVLGDIAVFWERDYRQGLKYLERSLTIAPRDAQARHWYAAALMGLGRFEQAAVQIAKARDIEPLSRSIRVSEAMIQLGLGRYDSARDELRQLIDNEPGYRSPYRFLSFVEFARGDYSAYLDALATRFTLTADKTGLTIIRAGERAFRRSGFAGMVRAVRDAIQALPAAAGVESYSLAHFFAVSGNLEMAAQRLLATSTRHAFYYGIDPAFALARQDTRFLQTIGNAGLPAIRATRL